MSEQLDLQQNEIPISYFKFPTIFQVVCIDMQTDEKQFQSFIENKQQTADMKRVLVFDGVVNQDQYSNSKLQDEGDINILIYSNNDQECQQFLEKLIKMLSKKQCNIFVEDQLFNQNQHFLQKSQFSLKSTQFQFISFIIILGSDSTILQTLQQLQNQPIPPLLTFKVGANAFICQFDKDIMDKIISDQINQFRISRQFDTQRRIRMEGILRLQNVITFKYHVLNEFVIFRGSNTHCLFIEIYINNILLTISSGDGIIISTPTGSTAYFLSAGGPIIQNDVQSISIIPICPLSLSFRPIVLPPCITITIKLSNLSRSNGFISADGQEIQEFNKDMIFEIKKSQYGIDIIQNNQINYSDWIDSLRNKLFWNTRIRE